MTTPTNTGYDTFLHDLKTGIRTARTRAALAVNRELVLLYWQIGRDILERQSREGWGAKVIDRLARDLRNEFPHMKGFSPRSLPKPGLTRNLCSRLLHKFPGFIIAS
jgi:predicted nuclease of restriction endonuclease-like (RecB) superfamily